MEECGSMSNNETVISGSEEGSSSDSEEGSSTDEEVSLCMTLFDKLVL